ncbi:hypothetical protein EVAR_56846_1 [Eumeta japonica]|uniref:Uncharacterized protein n=1 Tax=Eumeta variegata TaxID=151549 RepID=A0A4C1ZFA9_EUMVA|nr:hypothetical protein EVAR_56846_1 [Eumeta japonica]
MQYDTDTQLAQFTCVIEELRAKIKEMESEQRDKMNVIIHEYEEKLQKSASEVTLLKDQQTGLMARTDANIEAYRRRIEELEERLKSNQFKQYLVQNSSSFNESPVTVERPYSVTRDPYNNNLETNRMVVSKPMVHTEFRKSSNKMPKLPQVNYSDNNFSNSARNVDKKGAFTISKKRKLFNEKDFIE